MNFKVTSVKITNFIFFKGGEVIFHRRAVYELPAKFVVQKVLAYRVLLKGSDFLWNLKDCWEIFKKHSPAAKLFCYTTVQLFYSVSSTLLKNYVLHSANLVDDHGIHLIEIVKQLHFVYLACFGKLFLKLKNVFQHIMFFS